MRAFLLSPFPFAFRSFLQDGKRKRAPKCAWAPKSRAELPTSGYHGVVRKSENCFQAKTLFAKKTVFIGSFTTAEAAARAYDECMRKLANRAPEALKLNFTSDAVAEVATAIADAACAGGRGALKACGACGEVMGVRIRVCRRCRADTGQRSAFKGVRAKSRAASGGGSGGAAGANIPLLLLPPPPPPSSDPASADAPSSELASASAAASASAGLKYQSFLWHNKVNHYLGTFHTEEEAALRYDDEVRTVFADAPHEQAERLNWRTRAEGVAAAEAARARCETPLPPIQTKRRRGAGGGGGGGGEEGEEEEGGGGGGGGGVGGEPRPKMKRAPKSAAAAAAAAAAAGGAGGAAAAASLAAAEAAAYAADAAATVALPPLSAVPVAASPSPLSSLLLAAAPPPPSKLQDAAAAAVPTMVAVAQLVAPAPQAVSLFAALGIE
jgi:hypothetical protein